MGFRQYTCSALLAFTNHRLSFNRPECKATSYCGQYLLRYGQYLRFWPQARILTSRADSQCEDQDSGRRCSPQRSYWRFDYRPQFLCTGTSLQSPVNFLQIIFRGGFCCLERRDYEDSPRAFSFEFVSF